MVYRIWKSCIKCILGKMTLIESEHNNSIRYLLDRDRDRDGLVIISSDNVARVEAMIAENSRYNGSLNSNNTSSSTACLTTLKQELDVLPNPRFQTVYNTMRAINRENSTRLSEGELKELANWLCVFSSSDILGYLEKPTSKLGLGGETYYLVSYLKRKTTANGNRKGRQNYSFATKFCHYACINFFKGKIEADNFPIIDNVVKAVFPKYAKNIIKRIVFDDYETFVRNIDDVLVHYKKCISRNGFDHLMWYANK